jgi:hypothetical protein
MANPGLLDYPHMVNEAGMDAILNNSRTRATTANPLGVNWIDGVGAPASMTSGTSFTFTAANLLTGIIVANPTASITATLDTAANLVAAVNTNSAGAVVGDYVCILIVNGSAGAFNITLAAGSGGGFDTNQAAGSRIITQNASKYCFIRLTNVTPGSEAYIIYS